MQVLNHQCYEVTFSLCLNIIKQRHSVKVFSGFHPGLGPSSSTSWFLIIVISGSHDWGVEGGVTEEELYMGVDPEVVGGGSQLETGVQILGTCWTGAGLCLEVVCTWEG